MPPEPEHELSDGISVISESDGTGGHTPPESDASGTAAKNTIGHKIALESLGDVFEKNKHKKEGYRPLTPPNTPETLADQSSVCPRIGSELIDKKSAREEMELRLYEEFQGAGFHNFMGIYRRHIFFLMVVGGIIGGTIGHLYTGKNTSCGCDKATAPLLKAINSLEQEKWNLERKVRLLEGGERENVWTGHQRMDSKILTDLMDEEITVEDEEEEIPSDVFEKMILDHIAKTGSEAGSKDEIMLADDPVQIKSDNDKNSREKRGTDRKHDEMKSYKKFDGSGEKYKKGPQRPDSGERLGKKSFEKPKDGFKKDWKKPSGDQSDEDHSDENFSDKDKKYLKNDKRYNAKEAKYQQYDNSGEKYDKRQKYTKDERKFDHSGERGDYKNSKYNLRRSSSGEKLDSREKYDSRENIRKNDKEWHDQRMRGREDVRNKHEKEQKNNWYLERGFEREINRVKGENDKQRRR